VLAEVLQSLNARDRDWLQATMAYPEDAVGHLMSQDVLTVRENQRVEQVLATAARPGRFTAQHRQPVRGRRRHLFKGVLPLRALLLNDPQQQVAELMLTDPVIFHCPRMPPTRPGPSSVTTLVSAPVVNERGKLVGRLTVDEVIDYIREESEEDALNMAGLRGDEDLFAPIWDSARNRWLWLSINLCTAFIASRAIGLFEDAITQIVALATLMPIVAGIGGNSGNQTTALVVRGWRWARSRRKIPGILVFKEIGVGLLNGVVVGKHGGAVRLPVVLELATGAGDGGGDAAEFVAGGADGRGHSPDPASTGTRSGDSGRACC
jgi:magnesium transporter